MADGRDGLVILSEVSHEVDDAGDGAQFVRGVTARDDQGIVVARSGSFEATVAHRTFTEVPAPICLLGFGGDDDDVATGTSQRREWLTELVVLKVVVQNQRHLFDVERHDALSLSIPRGWIQ